MDTSPVRRVSRPLLCFKCILSQMRQKKTAAHTAYNNQIQTFPMVRGVDAILLYTHDYQSLHAFVYVWCKVCMRFIAFTS